MVGGAVAVLAALVAQQGMPELYAGGTLELRVGRAPTSIKRVGSADDGTERWVLFPQSHVMASATPLLGVRWARGSHELRAVSTTRVLWRPVPMPNERPLLLQTLELSHRMRPSQRTSWQLALRSTLGEEDYTSMTRRISSSAMAPLSRSVFTVGATSNGSWMASRRTTLGLLLDASYRLPLDEGSATTITASDGTNIQGYVAMPTQTSVTVSPVLRYRLGRRTSLEVVTPISNTDLRNVQLILLTDQGMELGTSGAHVNILTVQPQLGVIREVNRRQQLRAFAGVTYATVLVNPDPSRNWLTLTPLGRVELDSLLTRTRESSVRSVVALTSSWYADSALGIAAWSGSADARLEGQFGPYWSASIRAAFTTNLNRPLPTSTSNNAGYVFDETTLQFDIPVRHRISTQTAIEFGGRYVERGPNLRGGDFMWRNRELWAFFTVTTVTSRVARTRQ